MLALTATQSHVDAKNDVVLYNLDSGFPRTEDANKTQHARALCIKHFQKFKQYARKIYAGSSGSDAGSVFSMSSHISMDSLMSLNVGPHAVPSEPPQPRARIDKSIIHSDALPATEPKAQPAKAASAAAPSSN